MESQADPSAALLARWQEQGDREALDQLLRIEVAILRERLRRQTGPLPPSLSTSDLAQEAVLSLIRVRETPTFEQPAGLRAYLWRSAWRLLGSHCREQREERLEGSASHSAIGALATTGGLRSLEDSDLALALQFTLGLLEPRDREILELVYFQELTVEAAAQRLGIENEAGKKRLVRARGRMAEKLGDWSQLIG